jgi:response regulator RpfG family c-di-GMP phosphodiesterase
MTQSSMSDHAAEPINILLVDDHPNNLVALEAVLQCPEYNLIKAHSGREAIKLIHEKDFALILLDVQMPRMDGFETAQRIKDTQQGKDTPIIFVTAIYKEDPFIRKGFEVGGIDYFGKPFDPEILKAKVNIYANLYHKSRLIKKHEKRLSLMEKVLKSDHALLENLPVGVMIADAEGTLYQGNEECQKIWDTIKQVRIQDYDQYQGWFAENGRKLKSKDWPMVRTFQTGETIYNELINIRSFNGVSKSILNSASPLRGERGETAGVLGIFQDITQQRLMKKL